MATKVQYQLANWQARLLDLSKRNRLINCNLGDRGAIQIVHPSADELWQRLLSKKKNPLEFVRKDALLNPAPAVPQNLFDAEKQVAPRDPLAELEICKSKAKRDQLLTLLTDDKLSSRLYRLSLNAAEFLTEKGVHVLYLGFGLLEWTDPTAPEDIRVSPLILLPVRLGRRPITAPWKLSLEEDDVTENFCVAEALRQQQLKLPGLPDDAGDMNVAWRRQHFAAVTAAIAARPGWKLRDDVVLGIFSFQKIAMWQDMRDHAQEIAKHELCASIASGRTFESKAKPLAVAAGKDFDTTLGPTDMHSILDCDSSQLEAILAVKQGCSILLDGPPGTGKSQTIANIIAETLAAKKTVLFVSEKAAALEVVKRRLDQHNLGDFCLECHSHKANKATVIAELGRCLDLPPETYRRDPKLDELTKAHKAINAYVADLHRVHRPPGLSAFEIHGQLAALAGAPRSRVRIHNSAEMNLKRLAEVDAILAKLERCRAVVADPKHHRWTGTRVEAFSLSLRDDAAFHLNRLAKELEERLLSAAGLEPLGFWQGDPTYAALESAIALAREASMVPDLPAEWFRQDPLATARKYAELNEIAEEYRRFQPQAAMFRGDAIAGYDPRPLAQVVQGATDWSRRLGMSPDVTLGDAIEKLALLLADIDRFQAMLEELRLWGTELTDMQFEPDGSTSTTERLTELATRADLLSELKTARPSWFTQRRLLLQKTAAEVIAKSQRLEARRAVYQETFQSTLFDIPLPDLAERASALTQRWMECAPQSSICTRTLEELLELGSASQKRLEGIASRVRELCTEVHTVSGEGAYVENELRLERILQQLNEIKDLEAHFALMRPQWLDCQIRATLRSDAERWRREDAHAQSLSKQLARLVGDDALRSAGRELILDYRRWRKQRRELTETGKPLISLVARLYSGADIPAWSRLARDVRLLDGYHCDLKKQLSGAAMDASSVTGRFHTPVRYSELYAGIKGFTQLRTALPDLEKRLRELRTQMRPFYVQNPPTMSDALLADVDRLHKCHSLIHSGTQLREELALHFRADAFAAAGRRIAHEAGRFRSIWQRLNFRAWRAFKRQAQDMYLGGAPASTECLFQDLARLRDYHQRFAEMETLRGKLVAEIGAKFRASALDEECREILDHSRVLAADWNQFRVRIKQLQGLTAPLYKGPSADTINTLLTDLGSQLHYQVSHQKAWQLQTIPGRKPRAIEDFTADAFEPVGAQWVEQLRPFLRKWKANTRWRHQLDDKLRRLGNESTNRLDDPRERKNAICLLDEYHTAVPNRQRLQEELLASGASDESGSLDVETTLRTLQVLESLLEALGLKSSSGIAQSGLANLTTICDIARHVRGCYPGIAADLLELEAAVESDLLPTAASPFAPASAALTPRMKVCRQRIVDHIAAVELAIELVLEPGKWTLTTLQKELPALQDYREQTLALQQLTHQLRDDLCLTPDGRADWETTCTELERINQIVAARPLPPKLVHALCEPDGLKKLPLRDISASVKQRLLSWRDGIAQADRWPALSGLREGATSWPLTRHQQTLTELGRDGRVYLIALEHVQSLLCPGEDLPLESLNSKGEILERLANLSTRAKSIARELGLPNGERHTELEDWLHEARQATWVEEIWQRHGGGIPPIVARAATDSDYRGEIVKAVDTIHDAPTLASDWQFLESLFDTQTLVSTGVVIENTPVQNLISWLTGQAAEVGALEEWLTYENCRRQLEKLEVGEVVTEVVAGEIALDQMRNAFRARVLELWRDAIYQVSPSLRQFSASQQDLQVRTFCELDARAIDTAEKRIRPKLLNGKERPWQAQLTASIDKEVTILRREANKKRRQLSLHNLFKEIPELLLRLKPCVMMSPLSVSTFLNAEKLQFDLVIFDEASQVLPQDAICAIYRGKQLVVAGDQKQLPPTTFFDRINDSDEPEDDEEEDVVDTSDLGSILDVCDTIRLPSHPLRWHYRSRREALIAFANHHIYHHKLITFPSIYDVPGNPAVRFEYVPQGQWIPGRSGGFNAIEAARVADLVREHFQHHADRSLGIVTFNQRHQMAVLEQIDRLRTSEPWIEPYFNPNRPEPFFVKNLENVQGDERDVILLSVGYGPDANGNVAMRFGPLNLTGGERRLNVAITRAKREIRLVASINSKSLKQDRIKSAGARLLQWYLEYAETGALPARQASAGGTTDDAQWTFEKCIGNLLRQKGLEIHERVGAGKFPIELAICDPQNKGRYLLGVECDGTGYHELRAARDRDRLRLDTLYGLGWQIHRIWSTAWIADPEGESRRLVDALQKAQKPSGNAGRYTRPRPSSSSATKPPITAPPSLPYPTSPTLQPAPPPGTAKPRSPDDIDTLTDAEIEAALRLSLRDGFCMQLDSLFEEALARLRFTRLHQRLRSRFQQALEAMLLAKQVKETAHGIFELGDEADIETDTGLSGGEPLVAESKLAEARRALCQVVRHAPQTSMRDAYLCRNLLNDFYGRKGREVYVLWMAVQERVVSDLAERWPREPHKLLLLQLTDQLIRATGIERQLAKWAMDSWVAALCLEPQSNVASKA